MLQELDKPRSRQRSLCLLKKQQLHRKRFAAANPLEPKRWSSPSVDVRDLQLALSHCQLAMIRAVRHGFRDCVAGSRNERTFSSSHLTTYRYSWHAFASEVFALRPVVHARGGESPCHRGFN